MTSPYEWKILEWNEQLFYLVTMDNHVFIKTFNYTHRVSFFCLGFYIPLENFSLICRRHYYQWRASNFDLYSALMATEQWGFFSVPHVLWHGASVYNGYLSCCRAFDLGLSRMGFEHPTFQVWCKRSDRLRHRRGFIHRVSTIYTVYITVTHRALTLYIIVKP